MSENIEIVKKESSPVIAFMLGIMAAAVIIIGGAFYLKLSNENSLLKNELDIAKKELQGSKELLARTTEQLTNAMKELDQAKTVIATKPDLPIAVGFRQAMMGPGLVARFANKSDRHLSIVARFNNPTTGDSKAFRLDLAPNVMSDFGHMEGWTFASGDTITLEHNDYSPISVNVR